ncbi:BTB domain-containing protein [Mycena indigotica]|uniref:BTB domain-containing protein n=1 Tax=Mycena indigotica TaxID=2126181 RepID=A0A8H6SGW3_9AGAR|nr:BTB domain-containing protein [Mycena indigotica]KAF7299338.1 BTB domain-containing protein [Mycena indigotica]
MSTSEPPLKRQRTDDENQCSVILRSKDFWFDDGNVILQVQSTQFRLSKSVLAMHSPVFRDMFSLPLPPEEPLVEGCPVVVLFGDTSEDWEYLLRAIFPKECFHDGADSAPSVPDLCAVLRLSKKYDIAGFRKRCVKLLKTTFPSSLEQLDDVVGFQWRGLSVKVDADTAEVCVQIINLAREVGLYSVLPSAFYTILHWQHGESGRQDKHIANLEHKEDQFKYLKACNTIIRCYEATPLVWLSSQSGISWDGCLHHLQCSAQRKALLLELLSAPDQVLGFLDEWNDEWDQKMCALCAEKAKPVYETTRIKCWEKLPEYFGLDDWDTLRKMDFE